MRVKFFAFLVLLTAVLSSCLVRAEDDVTPRLVLRQPSFEVANAKGGPAEWVGSVANFTIDTNEARTGNASLKWVNDNPDHYVLCSQRTKLKAGDIVEFSVWVKTKEVTKGVATICMEWSGKNGKWLGGVYANGAKGTNNEWKQVKQRAVIPDGAASIAITCYVTQGGTGTAWFDDVELKTFVPPFISAITSDHYRHQTIGDPVKVRVGVRAMPEKYRNKKISGQLDLVDTAGKVVETFSAQTVEGDSIEFEVKTASLKTGRYQAVARIMNPVSSKEEKASFILTRLARYPDRKSYIDANRRLILDGKPFFPLGLYFGGVTEKDVKYLANSPFNCIMPYHPISREKLDLLGKNKIKCIYSVKDNFPGLQVKNEKEGIEKTRATVERLKDHPAIIAWYINDELPLTMLKELSARRDFMEELDPGRPAWVVLYQIEEIRSYIPTFDVVGTDPYPLSQRPAGVAAEWSRKTNDAVFRYHATWQVPQIFNWAAYRSTKEQKSKLRAPTFEEMRGMAWMNIAGGANGLIFYSYFDLWKMDKTIEEGGHAVVREPFDKRWAEVCKMGAEISECLPILLMAGKPLAVKPSSDCAKEIVWRLYADGPETWLLMVNSSDKTQKASFELPSGASLKETRLGSPVEVQGGKIVLDLPALEPRLVKIGKCF